MTQAQGAAAPPPQVQRPRTDPSGTILWLDDPRASAPARSGGKGANLARLCQAGLPVPAGFVVDVEAYRRFVDEAGIGPLVARTAREVTGDDADALADASAALVAAFEATPVPRPLAEAIAVAWRQLGAGPVAVRSSATAEDLPRASFAGQQDTVLGVTGADQVTAAVRRCWSSLWTTRALAYRTRQGIDHTEVAAAVVVQRMVAADVAGVLFTADPLTGRRDHVMVEAVRGLGAPLVGGRVTPQRWVVDGPTQAVLTAPDPTGREVPLDDARLRELTTLGLRAAGLLGAPQDVEWAVAGDRCWIVQSRPITSLFPLPTPIPAAAGLRVYMPLNLVAQGMTEPFTPAGCAFFVATAMRSSTYWSLRGRRALAGILAPVRPGTSLLRRHPVRRVPTAGGTALRTAPAQGPDGRRSARGVGPPRGCPAASPSETRPRDGPVGLVAPSGPRAGGGCCRSGPCAAAAARACGGRAPPAAARGGRSEHGTGAAGLHVRDPAQVCRGPGHGPAPTRVRGPAGGPARRLADQTVAGDVGGSRAGTPLAAP